MNSPVGKMIFDNVDQEFLSAFPELRERYAMEFDYWGDDSKDRPGSYLLFGIVVFPFLTEVLDSGENARMLTRLFEFFEAMANSQDREVLNLLQLEITDKLLCNPARLAKAWKYIGNSTKYITRESAKYLNLDRNLPREGFRRWWPFPV